MEVATGGEAAITTRILGSVGVRKSGDRVLGTSFGQPNGIRLVLGE